MNDISERCRYTYYKKVKYAELNNRNAKEPVADLASWAKNRTEALRLAWKEYKYTRKAEKVCPGFTYIGDHGLRRQILVRNEK